MSDQLKNEISQPKMMTPQELRESLLTELEAGKQALTELSDEEVLEAITGGGLSRSFSAPSLGQIILNCTIYYLPHHPVQKVTHHLHHLHHPLQYTLYILYRHGRHGRQVRQEKQVR